MKKSLHQAAREYVEIIRKIERTSDPKKLQHLEEKRVELRLRLQTKNYDSH